MGADDVVRARIGEGLKREFQDICPNMSQCLVALIEDYVEDQKEKYTKAIITLLKKDCAGSEEILALGELIDRLNLIAREGINSPQELIRVLRQDNKSISDELIILIYRDLLMGLYAGKDKEDLKSAAERLSRNKEQITAYIQQKLVGE